jgi:hypothetical protein
MEYAAQAARRRRESIRAGFYAIYRKFPGIPYKRKINIAWRRKEYADLWK